MSLFYLKQITCDSDSQHTERGSISLLPEIKIDDKLFARKDFYGQDIKKGEKAHHIKFQQPLEQVTVVDNWKRINKQMASKPVQCLQTSCTCNIF